MQEKKEEEKEDSFIIIKGQRLSVFNAGLIQSNFHKFKLYLTLMCV